MKILKFYGYSDDTFGEYAVTNDDVDNCASGTPIQCRLDSSEGYTTVLEIGVPDDTTLTWFNNMEAVEK